MSDLPKSRKDAKEAGLKRYMTGKPCKGGHMVYRYTTTGHCSECLRIYLSRKPYRKNYAEKNKDFLKERMKFHYENNKELRYADSIEWRKNNPEKWSEYQRRYKDNNRHLINAKESRRRAAKNNATPKWADIETIKLFYECCPAGCEVDHIVPLKSDIVCGLHVETNLQWLPASENRRKGNRFWPDMPESEVQIG